MLKTICTLVFLSGNAWRDWRKREISPSLLAVYSIGGILCSILEKRAVTDWMLPLGIGVLVLAFGFLTRGGIGIGDGLLLLALGSLLDADSYVRTLVIGLLLSAFFSGILLVVMKKSRKTEIPLVPFLLAGYIGGLIL